MHQVIGEFGGTVNVVKHIETQALPKAKVVISTEGCAPATLDEKGCKELINLLFEALDMKYVVWINEELKPVVNP